MLSTTLSVKHSLKNSSNRGTNTPHVGMETTLHGKKTLICVTTVSDTHRFSMGYHAILHFIYS